MGALFEDPLSVSQLIFPDRLRSKVIFDNVHGNIHLDSMSLKFIDTEEFQRLRDVKQLGLCAFVFPGAVHTRFEHSVGVYAIAGEVMKLLTIYQGRELGIERSDITNVKLAGLLHDVGHGPFSHVFEHEFLPRVLVGGLKWTHEEMSEKMVDHIVDEHNIDIDPGDLKNVKAMILGSSHRSYTQNYYEKRFLFDIVANGQNGIDVDKFDYIERDCRACGITKSFSFTRLLENMRVIDDEICYRAKEYNNVYMLFQTRADLFRTVYTHSKVKALEFMLIDALLSANNYLQISEQVFEPQDFWKLDDTILKTIETSDTPELEEARKIVIRMRRRELYQYCNEYAVPKEKIEYFKDVTPQDIACSQVKQGVHLSPDDIVVSNVKIDLTCGKENPLDRVCFFPDFESQKKFPIAKERVSQLLPDWFEDRIVRVYAKRPELVGAVSAAFENFQRRTYGVTTQIHRTPDSKTRRRS